MNLDILDLYARDQRRRNLRPQTIIRTRDNLRSLARHHEDRALLDLSKDDIDAWIEAVPRVARTRYNLISCAASFYDWAIGRDLLDVNPTRNIIRPKLRRGLPRPISHEDLAIAVHTATPMIRAWLLLAALGGLRCQEIAGVSRQDVWDQEEPGVLVVVEAKGGQQRIVPLHPDVLRALRAQGMRPGLLFRNRFGHPYSPARVSQIGNEHLRAFGIDATMHQLRHRFGTDVYALSNDLRLTQELLGHQSPTTTAIYTQINPAKAVAVVQQLAVRSLVST